MTFYRDQRRYHSYGNRNERLPQRQPTHLYGDSALQGAADDSCSNNIVVDTDPGERLKSTVTCSAGAADNSPRVTVGF